MENLAKITDLTKAQIASVCDHTFLKTEKHFAEQAEKTKANPKEARIRALADFLEQTCNMDAVPYGICVYPEDVKLAKEYFAYHKKQIKLAAVAGFPNGSRYSTAAKIHDAEKALDAGADEIDMVLNYDSLKRGHFMQVLWDIGWVVEDVHKGGGLVKVIFETAAFDSNPVLIKKACEMCTKANADFVKTSTGFMKNPDGSVKGAKADDLRVMRANFDKGVKMAGGIKPENVYELLEAVSGRNDGYIELDPMKVRIGESSLLSELNEKY